MLTLPSLWLSVIPYYIGAHSPSLRLTSMKPKFDLLIPTIWEVALTDWTCSSAGHQTERATRYTCVREINLIILPA